MSSCDGRGVLRGACTNCDQCLEYERPADTQLWKCDYCECLPTKHVRLASSSAVVTPLAKKATMCAQVVVAQANEDADGGKKQKDAGNTVITIKIVHAVVHVSSSPTTYLFARIVKLRPKHLHTGTAVRNAVERPPMVWVAN